MYSSVFVLSLLVVVNLDESINNFVLQVRHQLVNFETAKANCEKDTAFLAVIPTKIVLENIVKSIAQKTCKFKKNFFSCFLKFFLNIISCFIGAAFLYPFRG